MPKPSIPKYLAKHAEKFRRNKSAATNWATLPAGEALLKLREKVVGELDWCEEFRSKLESRYHGEAVSFEGEPEEIEKLYRLLAERREAATQCYETLEEIRGREDEFSDEGLAGEWHGERYGEIVGKWEVWVEASMLFKYAYDKTAFGAHEANRAVRDRGKKGGEKSNLKRGLMIAAEVLVDMHGADKSEEYLWQRTEDWTPDRSLGEECGLYGEVYRDEDRIIWLEMNGKEHAINAETFKRNYIGAARKRKK